MILILTACSSSTDDKPEYILPKEKMVAFLIDSHMKEGQLTAAKISKDSARVLFKDIEQDLYKEHDIDSVQFLESYHYYLDHVEQLADIYDAVIDSLSLKEKVLINEGN